MPCFLTLSDSEYLVGSDDTSVIPLLRNFPNNFHLMISLMIIA